jgi:hypothetical protein
MNIKIILLTVWQFPQQILGYIISRIWKTYLAEVSDETVKGVVEAEQKYTVKIYVVDAISHRNHRILKYLTGFAIGDYICIDSWAGEKTVWHEVGHNVQSEYLGIFYILVIGIPSIVGNLIARRSVRWNWNYYQQPWEAWADRLGGVVR